MEHGSLQGNMNLITLQSKLKPMTFLESEEYMENVIPKCKSFIGNNCLNSMTKIIHHGKSC